MGGSCGAGSRVVILFFLFFFFKGLIFSLEKERESERAHISRGKDREREKEAPCCAGAWHRTLSQDPRIIT